MYEQFCVSRKCGHKWLVRFAQGGAKALVDAGRPSHTPQKPCCPLPARC
ncbi:leucine zipper domain-containing protein [Prosthecobacter sp.]